MLYPKHVGSIYQTIWNEMKEMWQDKHNASLALVESKAINRLEQKLYDLFGRAYRVSIDETRSKFTSCVNLTIETESQVTNEQRWEIISAVYLINGRYETSLRISFQPSNVNPRAS